MINHSLIVPFRRHTLTECDQIIMQAAGITRTGPTSDGSVRIVECTIDWLATKDARTNGLLEEDELFVICSHCMCDQPVNEVDNGLQRCKTCNRKLTWRVKDSSTWRSRFDEGAKK